MKSKHDRKDIKLLAAKKTTHIELNALSADQIYNSFFQPLSTIGSPVTQKLSQERKILRTWDQRQS